MAKDSGRAPTGQATHASHGAAKASPPSGEYPSRKPCEFPGSYAACQKCAPCLSIYVRRAAVAAPHDNLIAQQSVRRCRMCNRIERYCQTDGQGMGRHSFAPVLTCESCQHFGGQYWGDRDNPIHFCGKSDERRRANFRSCGDRSEDFMREFRTFYDASPRYSAEGCAFFEAIADTHPKDGDAKQAPLVSGGGARSAIAQEPSQ